MPASEIKSPKLNISISSWQIATFVNSRNFRIFLLLLKLFKFSAKISINSIMLVQKVIDFVDINIFLTESAKLEIKLKVEI